MNLTIRQKFDIKVFILFELGINSRCAIVQLLFPEQPGSGSLPKIV